MALQLLASIYGANGNDYKNAAGKTMSFPTQGIRIEAVSPAVTYGGVACNTAIYLLPFGLNVPAVPYYSPTATATVVTAANA